MSAIRYMSVLTVFSVFAALISIVWQAFISLKKLNQITTVLTVFLSIESSFKRTSISPQPKIAIGYGACSDLLINGVDFLNFTRNLQFDGNVDYSADEINNLDELLQSFGYFFQKGAAAERFITNTELFSSLIKNAKTNHRERMQWFLGGNAALMGLRFHLEGAKVLLGARMSHKLRRLVPEDIQITGEPLTEDEIHLILEYKAGDTWGGQLTAPRANRFIVHNDRYNPQLQVAEQFGKEAEIFKPRLFVVTGLHVMDKYKFEPGLRKARLQKVQQQLAIQGDQTLSHFEMASYVDIELLLLLGEHVLPYVDSLGMNEQELSNLGAVLTTGGTTTATDWNPDVSLTLDQMRLVYRYLAEGYFKERNESKRLLSRMHLHTLAYQIVLTKRDSQWRNSKTAAAKASLIAHRYVCQTEMINPEAATLLLPDKYYTSQTDKRNTIKLDPKNPVACWFEHIEVSEQPAIEVEICVAPVLVCRVAKKAAGAGDNISAAALSQQL